MKGLGRGRLERIDVELKEAVCDSIVNMLVGRVSATDDRGEVLYGRSPRRSVVSGQLLPRFDVRGEDDTSDIAIAAMGLDFVVDAEASVEIEAKPRFSVYVRVLPTWAEIGNGGPLDIEFRLKPAVQKEIDDAIRERQRTALSQAGLLTPDWSKMDETERHKVRERREALTREINVAAYKEKGIILVAHDLDESEVSGEIDDDKAADPNEPESIEEVRPAIAKLLRDGRKIPYHLVDPAPIPGKWRRLALTLPSVRWMSDANAATLAATTVAFNEEMNAAVVAQVFAWLGGPGMTEAWRDQKVEPRHAESEEQWNSFLEEVRQSPPDPAKVRPDLSKVQVKIEAQRDFVDPSRLSCRILLDNQSDELDLTTAQSICNTVFGTGLSVTMPISVHRELMLDRVEPSYRFRDYLRYPAIGLNCGVTASDEPPLRTLTTTWAPRFGQPRIKPRDVSIESRFKALADQDFPIDDLLSLPDQYEAWVKGQRESLTSEAVAGLSSEDAAIETQRLDTDTKGQLKEAEYIRRGVELLSRSRKAAQALRSASAGADTAELRARAAPWRAWTMTNEAFARRDRKFPDRGWRLFQMAFVLAHVPVFASRMDVWKEWHDPVLDEDCASLLYFPTGGGKSEAFYGALLFAMFLDRLRGKDRGLTAFIRYPLRLLTLQQAQRLLKLVVHAEIVRKKYEAGRWPFEMGFWVGNANTPNRYSGFGADVPLLRDTGRPDDSWLDVDDGDEKAKERAQRYRNTRESYDKVPNCPMCGEPTGLRRNEREGKRGKRISIVCFNARCEWNEAHGPLHPLPFLLTDDAIYARAPAIVLGTVDKMAMLGQSTSTISNVFGMFGVARWIDRHGNFDTPRKSEILAEGPEANDCEPVFPAYRHGKRVFHDPFPSLIIQDEAHLLEESLGTFSGLFDSLLETILRDIDDMAGGHLGVARDASGKPRMPKIVAATATISSPERQLETLYQRRPLRFPYPGPELYRSFFSEPEAAPAGNPERSVWAQTLERHSVAEATAPWMRLYVSLMTNDATHTVTTVNVLSAFHAIITELWDAMPDPLCRAGAVDLLRKSISSGRRGDWHRTALDRAVAGDRWDEIQALIDLHRIALAYVTNKKGGDQIIDALAAGVHQHHRRQGRKIDQFYSELISGGIDMKKIQQIMEVAETSYEDSEYPDIEDTLRNIVATSAISHGVDVERFNSMFFAGLPSDVAEYIQASSRVGRTHVGFVMLLPTPQSRRDRYVVETHDIFHRFLERMIAPPAVERWAENAVVRTFASFVQAWTMLKEARQFIGIADDRKQTTVQEDQVKRLGAAANRHMVGFADDLRDFILAASGADGHGPDHVGRPHYYDHYFRLAEKKASEFGKAMARVQVAASLQTYWSDNPVFQKPMTSLRDVDEAGAIRWSHKDPWTLGQSISESSVIDVMRTIREQRGNTGEMDADGGQDG